MKYLSVCSGIEAATAAWHPLGWKPWAFSEIEKFPSAVLAVHYPDVPNLGDMTKFKDWPDAAIDVLVGGTPCQSYSVAGLRKGLDDPRGDLMLTYVAIARRYRPSWVVWENVPGVLSDDGGRSFGTLLGLLTGSRVEVPPGGWQSAGFVEGYRGAYGVAWRVLDSQFVRVDGFGRAVPQRRRRVFVVGYLGDWRRAAAVLFERESMSGNPAPRRESGKGIAPTISARPSGGGGLGTDFDLDGGLVPDITGALACNSGPNGHDAGNFHCNQGVDAGYIIPEIANPLTARMHKGVNTTMDEGQTMIGEPVAFDSKASGRNGFGVGDTSPTLRAMSGKKANAGGQVAIAFDTTQITSAANRSNPQPGDPSHPLAAGAHPPTVAFQPRFARNGRGAPDTVASALTGEAGRTGKGDSAQCVAFSVSENSNGFAWESDVNPTLQAKAQCASANQFDGVLSGWAVRRLTPTECERLQAFPDGYTNIPWRGKNGAPDGPRYKALGNSMSLNVMRWIGMRIEKVEAIAK
jgi:DNA (cytosine-5)-methyltransferase 1